MNPLLDFSTALQLVKIGDKIARQGWNGKGMYVFYQEGYTAKGTHHCFLPYLMMKTADGSFVPWLASQTDILANDWMTIPADLPFSDKE